MNQDLQPLTQVTQDQVVELSAMILCAPADSIAALSLYGYPYDQKVTRAVQLAVKIISIAQQCLKASDKNIAS